MVYFLSTSESENLAPQNQGAPCTLAGPKKGRFSAPAVPDPIPWPVSGPHWESLAGRNNTGPRSSGGPPAAASQGQGAPHSQMRGRWSRLQRNTTTFGKGGSHPIRLKPRLGPEKGRFTGAKPTSSKTGRAGHPRGEHPRLSLAPSLGVMAPQPPASQNQLWETRRTSGQESPRA